VEAFTNTIGLRCTRLGFGMLDVIEGQILQAHLVFNDFLMILSMGVTSLLVLINGRTSIKTGNPRIFNARYQIGS
jgi:hypothetical protein